MAQLAHPDRKLAADLEPAGRTAANSTDSLRRGGQARRWRRPVRTGAIAWLLLSERLAEKDSELYPAELCIGHAATGTGDLQVA